MKVKTLLSLVICAIWGGVQVAEAADDVVIYGSVERSEAWVTSSQYKTGFYSVSLTKDFEALGATRQSPTVTDGAVYVDGYCYYLNKTFASVVRYKLEFCKMNVQTWQVESRIEKENGSLSLANDMTYDPVSHTVYAASPRSFGSRDTDLRTVDLTTGEFTTVAQLSVGIRAIAANSKGELFGLGTEVEDGVTTTRLYRIDKATGTVTRIGDVGFNMTEGETGMAFDLRDDRLYWTANYYTDDELWQRTYSSGIVELDTTTGKGTLLKAFKNTEKVVGMFINTDQPNGAENPTPQGVTNLRYELLEGDTSVRLTWDAPTLCVDERTPVDASTLTYTVKRLTDGQVVAEGLTETTLTDTPPFQMQSVAYTVTACTASGTAAPVRSAIFICGKPYSVPYLETFDRQANFNAYTVIDTNGDGDPENSGGLFLWDYINSEALYYTNFRQADDWLITPAITLPTDRVMRLRFGTHGYLANGAVNTFDVTIGARATAEAQSRVLLHSTYTTSQTPLWQTALFVPREGESRIGFHNVSNGSDHLYIDNVYVVDYGPLTIPAAPSDAAFSMGEEEAGVVISVTAPTTDVAGAPLAGPLTLDIYRGASTKPFHTFTDVQPGERLTWIDNDVALGQNDYLFCAANADGSGMELTASFLNTNVVVDDDEEDIPEVSSLLPYVTDLRLTEDYALVWSDATTYPALHPVAENVDAMEAFSIEGGNGWTTRDQDGARTMTISAGATTLNWPHATEAQAFIVFRPASINMEDYITPRSGDQCFVAFASAGRQNDDWLISPQLCGEQQTISFYAKCLYPDCLNERFEVWASASDTRPESFICISGEAPRAVTSAAEWQRFRYTLPAGTRHFAIRCVSNDQFGLMIDDLRFTPAYPPADLIGYNVYCNGVKLNEEPVEDPRFDLNSVLGTLSSLEVSPLAGSLKGTVKALYMQGESIPSNAVEIMLPEGVNVLKTTPSDSNSGYYDLQGRKISAKEYRLIRKNVVIL